MMGKRSQAKHLWPKKERELHDFSERVVNTFGHVFKVLHRGLTRPATVEPEKQMKEHTE